MSRLCWLFVLLAVVVVVIEVPLSDASSHNCKQRERSLADLDQAEDALKKAKLLVTNCEEENESSYCYACSKKRKSLRFIDDALALVSNTKKNTPICLVVPTEEPTTTTREPSTTTKEPSTTSLTPTPEVTTEVFRPTDCQELQAAGVKTSGVFTVWPRGGKSVEVRCDMDTDGGGWTVIQRRGKFRKQANFDRNWQDYKNGFGHLEMDFWLGNDIIFSLTNQGAYSLRMDMTAADGKRAYALFREFRIEGENANYKLHVSGYSGTAGDSLTFSSNKQMFSTKDKKNCKMAPGTCADTRKGGFWYYSCSDCNPNGLYEHGSWWYGSTMFYYSFKGFAGLSSIDMKIKRL